MKRFLIHLLKVAAFCGAASFIISCTNDLDVVKSLNVDESQATQTGKHITTLYSEGGKIKVKMISPVLQRFENAEDPKTIFPQGLEIFFYDQNNKVSSSLICNYAIYYEVQKLWEARNNVIGKNTKGETLNTERLFWNEKTRRIYSNDYTTVKSVDGSVYRGNKFESDDHFENYTLSGFSGNINIKNE
ncbi:MAG TPA: LPS export ABC transporter periplasmic protein LptC [Williamwhitmania sp.]|nr:LPS export ABC transporter periplasmic protein LptC [Williamwhitmania sp.]